MRPPGFYLCGFVALSLLICPIHAANTRPPAKRTGEAKPAVAKPKPVPGMQEHVVKKGETLWSISQKYNASVGEVMELNKMAKEAVREGMKLKIPPRVVEDARKERKKVHVVDDDETFWSIANAYDITPEALANANPNVNPNRLHPDMELNIPPAEPGQAGKVATAPKTPVTLKGPESEASSPPKAEAKVPSASKPPVGSTVHTIAEGDTFYALGRKYGVSMEAIVAANPEVNPRRIKNGTQIVIPDKVAKAPDAKPEPPVNPKPAEKTVVPVKPAVPTPAPASPPVISKAPKPLPPTPAPNTLPISKPKLPTLNSEQVKKQVSAPVPPKADKRDATSPVIVTAPSPPPVPAPAPRVDAPSKPVSAPSDREKVASASTQSSPPAPIKSSPPDMVGPKPPANTVSSDGVIRSYIVSAGESEGTICEDFGISKEQLYEYNRLPASAKLKAGDEIMIPRVAKIGQ